MKTHVRKNQKNNNKAVSNESSVRQNSNEAVSRFADNRPEAIARKKLQEEMSSSPRVKQLQAIQEMANHSPKAQQAAQLQAMANHYAVRTAQRTALRKETEKEEEPLQGKFETIQNRVKPTKQLKPKVNINDAPGLEQEAEAMGAKANRSGDSGVMLYQRLTNKPVLQAKLQSNVIQRVSEEETGAYLGYTFGGDKPTFYFEKGHYTWQHKKKKNEGWHPNEGARHFIKNIDEEVHKKYSDEQRYEWDRKQKTAFGKKIEKGKYDAKEGKGKMIEGSVHVKKDKSEEIFLHPSRGRFIKVDDKDFDKKYNEEFVRNIVSKGKLAENEVKG